jgi:hypothetical protein
VGVKLNGAAGPEQPDVVKVTVKVGKAGDGGGRISATGLNCGSTCFATFAYGTLARLTAAPDDGSVFGGWGGICDPDTDLRCTLPVGPITFLRPRFVKDAPPSAPGSLRTSVTDTSVTAAWDAARDDVGIKAYEVFVGSEAAPRVTTASTSATISGLTCGTPVTVGVQAADSAGNRSSRTTAQATTAPCGLVVRLTGTAVTRGAKPRLTLRFAVGSATKGMGTLFLRGKRVARVGVVLRAGANALVFRIPRAAGRRDARFVLRLVDPKGGAKTFTFRTVVRT